MFSFVRQQNSLLYSSYSLVSGEKNLLKSFLSDAEPKNNAAEAAALPESARHIHLLPGAVYIVREQ